MDASDIFIFLLLGGGERESEAPGRFFVENPRTGGSPGRVGWGAARGREGVCEDFFFFRCRNSHQDLDSAGPKRGSLNVGAGKRQESATFFQCSFFNAALQFFACCSAAFGKNDFRTAEKRI